jgi:hypothetical protein
MCIMCKMSNITLSVPEDLKKKMDEHSIINWSEVARQAFIEKIADLEFLQDYKNGDLAAQDAKAVRESVASYAKASKAERLSSLYDNLLIGASQLSDKELVALGRELKYGRAKELKSALIAFEKHLKGHPGEYDKKGLWESLPKKIPYETYSLIFDFFEKSVKIALDRNGIVAWIYYPDHVAKYRNRPDLEWRHE